jgi:hypothetical protein
LTGGLFTFYGILEGSMSIVYQIDKRKGITYVVWDGLIGAGEYLSHVDRLLSDPDWPPSRGLHLSDLRSVVLDPTIDESVLEKAANLFSRHPKISTVKTAIVAHQAFEKAVTYEHLISKFEPSMIVFHNLITACTWLGIDAEATRQVLDVLRISTRDEKGHDRF